MWSSPQPHRERTFYPSGLGSCSGFLLMSAHFLSRLDCPCAQNWMKCQRKLVVCGTMRWKVHQFNKILVGKEEQKSSKANYVKGDISIFYNYVQLFPFHLFFLSFIFTNTLILPWAVKDSIKELPYLGPEFVWKKLIPFWWSRLERKIPDQSRVLDWEWYLNLEYWSSIDSCHSFTVYTIVFNKGS